MTEPTPELATSLTTDDTGRLLEAESTVRSLCGWHIAPLRTEPVKVDGSGTAVLLLPTLLLADVASIVENGDVVDVADVDWNDAGILTRRNGCWTGRTGGVVVTIVHGYAEVPPDVRGLVRSIAARIPTEGRKITAHTTGPFSETFSEDDLSDLELRTVARYRIPNV